MTGGDALTLLRHAYADRIGEAARAKAVGETVIGYFLNSVPIEISLAAGLRPIRFVGDPLCNTVVADRYMEEYMDGEVRAIFAAMLHGTFASADLIVIPRTSETYLQLYYYLIEMKRWEPTASIPPFALFDLLQSPHWVTARYDLGRMKDLAQRLSSLPGGHQPSDARLAAAIATANRLRRAIVATAELWRGPRPRIDGVDALRIMGAALVLSPETAIAALEALLEEPPTPLLLRGPRLMLKGSPQHDTRLTALIEECGAHVVAHDHVAGDASLGAIIDEHGNPWEALVSHYQSHIPGPRAQPQARLDVLSLDAARAASVDGVIIAHDEWDDTLGWEYPDQRRLFEDAGIPTLFLKRQPYVDPPTDQQRAMVCGFLANLPSKVSA